MWGYRFLDFNGLTGPMPTELGTLTALTRLCVRHPHPPRLDVSTVTGLWAERGGGVGMQGAGREQSHGGTAHRAGHHGRADLPVRVATLTHRTWTCAPSPGCGLSAAVACECRTLARCDLTGTMPTELGTMDALTYLCVRHPHPPRLDACAFTGCGLRGMGFGCAGGYTTTL
jgi:hypothetical protein